VARKLKYDGAATAPIDEADTDFQGEVMKYLKDYTRKTFCIYLRRREVSTATDDQEVLLPDEIFYANRVWVNGSKLFKRTRNHEYDTSITALTSGQPRWFSNSEDGRITFDRPLSETAATAETFVEGWAAHPDVTEDNYEETVLYVGDRFIDEIGDYIAWKMMAPVVTDEAAVLRMKGYAFSAKAHVQQRRGANMMRDLDGVYQ